MGHGTPDWWGAEPTETIYGIQDVGELAARLGSIDTFDRRGNVLFIDSFEHGLAPYFTGAEQAGSAVVLSALTARSGAYSCKLTTGAVANALAYVARHGPYPVLSKYGFEVAFTVDDNAVEVRIGLTLYDGVNSTGFIVRYLPATDKWQYYNSAGTWVDLATGVALLANTRAFHVVKLVVDLETGEYFYFLWDSDEVSMAGLGGKVTASALSPTIDVSVTLMGGAGAAATIYVDDFIMTQNEP